MDNDPSNNFTLGQVHGHSPFSEGLDNLHSDNSNRLHRDGPDGNGLHRDLYFVHQAPQSNAYEFYDNDTFKSNQRLQDDHHDIYDQRPRHELSLHDIYGQGPQNSDNNIYDERPAPTQQHTHTDHHEQDDEGLLDAEGEEYDADVVDRDGQDSDEDEDDEEDSDEDQNLMDFDGYNNGDCSNACSIHVDRLLILMICASAR